MNQYKNFKYFLNEEFKNWDPEKYNWKKETLYLIQHCRKYFCIWWNSEKFNWEKYSYYLPKYYYRYFDIWWNKEKFNYDKGITYLFDFCLNDIDKWWDLDKISEYFGEFEIDQIIRINNEKHILNDTEIIKLKLLKGGDK